MSRVLIHTLADHWDPLTKCPDDFVSESPTCLAAEYLGPCMWIVQQTEAVALDYAPRTRSPDHLGPKDSRKSKGKGKAASAAASALDEDELTVDDPPDEPPEEAEPDGVPRGVPNTRNFIVLAKLSNGGFYDVVQKASAKANSNEV